MITALYGKEEEQCDPSDIAQKKMGVKSPICSPFHRPGSLWPVNQVNKDRQVFWFQTSAQTETTCYWQLHSGYEINFNYLLGHMMCWYIANCQEHKHRMHVNHPGGGAKHTEVKSSWWNVLWTTWGLWRDTWKYCQIQLVTYYSVVTDWFQ